MLLALMQRTSALSAGEAAAQAGINPARSRRALDALADAGVVDRAEPAALDWQRPEGSGRPPDRCYRLANAWGFAVGVA